MKDEMISKKKFDPGDKFILEIGEKRMALDEYEIVGTDLWVWGSLLEKLTPYEPDHIADVSKKVDADLISRREALEALKALEEKPKALEDDYDFGRRQMLETCIDIIQDLQPSPSAQSIERLKNDPEAEWVRVVRCKDCKHNPKDTWFGCPMAHCSETQRPETAWCWKGKRREE